MKPRIDLTLYLATDDTFIRDNSIEGLVQQACDGGITAFQLRLKRGTTLELINLGRRIKPILRAHRIPLIVNDRVDVALAVEADGVHLGHDDMAPEDARRILGPDAIIGFSVSNQLELARANQSPIDYIGIGPFALTNTKSDAGDALGVEATQSFVAESQFPAVAIGGIGERNVLEVMQTGVTGVCVVSAICGASNVRIATESLRRAVSGVKE